MSLGPRDDPERRDVVERRDVLGRREHYRGPVIGVATETVAMPGGPDVDRDVIAHPGSVGILAVDDALRVLVLRQYRHPVAMALWELPAGLLDVGGEAPLAAARRELYEETHHAARDWRVLLDAYTSPGITDEATRIYLAREVGPAAGQRHVGRHEEADMPLAWVDLNELFRAVLAGHLHNPLIVMGVSALRAAIALGSLDDLRPADAPWPARPA